MRISDWSADGCSSDLLGKPLVYGAVHRFEGQVSVFDAGRARGVLPCYRCLFPEPPADADAPNYSEAGVLAVLPGVIGMLQATDVVRSEERRVGNECVRTCRSRWSPIL